MNLHKNQYRFLKLLEEICNDISNTLEDHALNVGEYGVVSNQPIILKLPLCLYSTIGLYAFINKLRVLNSIDSDARMKSMLNSLLRDNTMYILHHEHIPDDGYHTSRELLNRATFVVKLNTTSKPYTWGYEKNRYK